MRLRNRDGTRVLVPIAIALTLSLASAAPATAFDTRRRGFVLEYGLGPAISTWIERGKEELNPSWATRFRLGWGVSDRVALMYVNDVSFSLDDIGFSVDAFTLSGVSGAGVRWYSQPEAPSWFAESAVGLATLSTTVPEEGLTGFGAEGGGGLEFSRSWGAGLTIRRLFGLGAYEKWSFDVVVSHIVY